MTHQLVRAGARDSFDRERKRDMLADAHVAGLQDYTKQPVDLLGLELLDEFSGPHWRVTETGGGGYDPLGVGRMCK